MMDPSRPTPGNHNEIDMEDRHGLTTEQVAQSRARHFHNPSNTVHGPLHLPPAVCCLLPCLKYVPSRQAFSTLVPEDAHVKRNGRWMCYDASSLVVGDLIRLCDGDAVPADCVVLQIPDDDDDDDSDEKNAFTELLVDVTHLSSRRTPRTAEVGTELPWGGRVVVGSCLARVTAIGSDVLAARLVANGTFPLVPSMDGDDCIVDGGEEDDVGIALIGRTKDGMA